MIDTIQNAYCNTQLSGACLILPLKASLEQIDQTTMHKIAKVFLSFLAYLVLGVPALIGIGINYHALSTSSLETEASIPSPQKDNICQTIKTQLEQLNLVFDPDLDQEGDVSHSIVLGDSPENTYEQDKFLEIDIYRELTDEEISALVEETRHLAEHGLHIDRIDMRVVNLPRNKLNRDHTSLIERLTENTPPLPGEKLAQQYGLIVNRFHLRIANLPNNRLTCVSIKLMIPDQFDLQGRKLESLCYS